MGDLHNVEKWGTLGNFTAFSFGTISCNIGTCWLNWIDNTPEHPIIGQTVFRYKDGRFEQLGQGWLEHGFFALSGDRCATVTSCVGSEGSHLGVSCSDPYSAGLYGNQFGLDPKFEVNSATGVFPYPATGG